MCNRSSPFHVTKLFIKLSIYLPLTYVFLINWITDDQSSNKPLVTVEQDTTEKEQEKPGKSGQEVPKDQKTPEGVKNQEFLHREHHGKEKPESPVEQKHDVEKKGEIPRNITRGGRPKPSDEPQSRSLRDRTQEPKKESQTVKDDHKHEKSKQQQPGQERMDKASKVKKVPQQVSIFTYW